MKELSIEEKARRYDEAIEKAGKIHNEHKAQPFDVMLKVFPELKELNDERIRKGIIKSIMDLNNDWLELHGVTKETALDWLEKQAEQANFRSKIQIGDKVTRNRDGVLVNLSQLNRVAKIDEKQGEQKPSEDEDREYACQSPEHYTRRELMIYNLGIVDGKRMDVHYIHQLQHALRLCGNEKDIVL